MSKKKSYMKNNTIIKEGFFDNLLQIFKVFPQLRKNSKIKKDEYVRHIGSDYKKKDLIIKKGTIIQPSHILAFKTLGITKIKVKKKPNILFFSTGNEISNKKNEDFRY